MRQPALLPPVTIVRLHPGDVGAFETDVEMARQMGCDICADVAEDDLVDRYIVAYLCEPHMILAPRLRMRAGLGAS